MTDTTNRVQREARLKWVPISKMKVNPLAQRDQNPARIDRLVADFDLEQLGTPTVNLRGGTYWIIDGQHRVGALIEMGWGDQQIQCWTYEYLTEQDEAEKFLKLNDVLVVQAMPKYRTAITAGRETECDIDRIVRSHGLVVTHDAVPGAVGAVGTLRIVYERDGATNLSRTLRIIRDSFGDSGFERLVINGVGMVTSRYNGELDDDTVVERLSKLRGGVNGLTGNAEKIHRNTGSPRSQCVAAATVDAVNSGRGGKKLPSWWKADD